MKIVLIRNLRDYSILIILLSYNNINKEERISEQKHINIAQMKNIKQNVLEILTSFAGHSKDKKDHGIRKMDGSFVPEPVLIPQKLFNSTIKDNNNGVNDNSHKEND